MSIFGERSMGMKKAERVGYILSIVLTILYIPVSFFSFLLGMLSEVVMDTTNQIFINLINILSCIAMLVPIFCFFGILLSIRCRKKGYIAWSFVFQFLPLIIFGMNILMIYIVDGLMITL